MTKRNVGVSELDLLQSVVLGGKEAEIQPCQSRTTAGKA